MKLQNRLIYILAVLITLPLIGTVAPAATLTVLQRFDFPSHPVAINQTLPQKVSDQGDMVGSVVDIYGGTKGFLYKFRIVKFSTAFQEPNDTGHYTQGRGINIRRHCVGEYLDGSDGTFHGYLLKHPDFFGSDVAGVLDTIPLGINNDGTIVGTVMLSDGTQPAYVSLNQTVTMFAVPGATATFAYQINATNQIIGYYIDANGINHGFTRDSDGNLTFPIDVPGSTGTILFGNNDLNWGVGRYTDAAGVTHGLYFITPDDILSFDSPYIGTTFTSLNGVNKNGAVCGYYFDTDGIAHGLVAQLDPKGTSISNPTLPLPSASQPNTNLPVAPVKPAQPAPERLMIAEPAF